MRGRDFRQQLLHPAVEGLAADDAGHFLTPQREIADPYYTRDFEKAYSEIYAACEAFLDYLSGRHGGTFAYDSRH